MPGQVPISKRRKRKKLSDHVKFNVLSPPKKGKKPARPSSKLAPGEPREKKVSTSAALSKAAAGLSGRGTAGRILKAAVTGAAAGSALEESYRSYKKERATAKGRKASITVDQAAAASRDRKKREKK